ncbi:MAG: aldo/keto reductase [Bacilli bacterium]|nr:aldo/keto reductase [Bacilli bacterium]MBQ9731454.1 aldo/keto reductase [Bacilli bacterium]
MKKVQRLTLNNKNTIPDIGFGTWQISNEAVIDAVITALECGYRHIDTAIDYGNEEGVGKALKLTDVKREEIFLTSKIPAHVKTYEGAKRCIEESLKRLQVDYLDLMLIHSPRPWEGLWDPNYPRYYKENLEVYKALEEAYKEKKIKSIGISNFFIDDVKNILENVEIKPVINQICVFIGNTPKELIKYCKENDILVEAYSPIATGRLLKNKELIAIAEKYDVSVPQLCIRYCMQIGTLPLPKSQTKEHIKSNLDVDFEIDKIDLDYLFNL